MVAAFEAESEYWLYIDRVSQRAIGEFEYRLIASAISQRLSFRPCGGAALSGLQKAVEPSQRLPHTLRPPTYNFQNTNAPTLSSHPTMSHLQSILDAMDAYANETGVNLKDNPFANKVKDCGSPNDVLLLLQENMKAFKDYRDKDRRFLDCLGPVVKSVHGLSRFLAEATSNVSRK